MNISKQTLTRLWHGGVVVIGLALLAYLLFFHRLGSLLPGFAPPELATYAGAHDWHTILHNPINAPYKIIVWLGVAIAHQGILTTRIVAASLGILAGLGFFLITRLRYRFSVALAGTILFTTSAGFLHVARLGTGLILQLGIVGLLCGLLWYRGHQRSTLAGYGLVALLALMWYVPGMIWFELLGFILLQSGLRRRLRRLATGHLLAWSGIFLVIILPLVLAAGKHPHLALAAAGLPADFHVLTQFPRHLLDTLLAIGIRSNGSPLTWVGHAPLLSAVESILVILGVVGYGRRFWNRASRRSAFLLGYTLLAIVLISLGGGVGFASLIPLLYLLAVGGLDDLVSQWFTVFPRNPIARGAGLIVVCVMLFFSVFYQIRSYFVAWPHASATRQTFSHRPPQQ